jgi:ubiquinone/menaquinone biosynthesis C-methylase UbiE
MKVKPYQKLALIYNRVMKNVDYNSWSKYILEIATNYLTSDAKVLELASGNCNMAKIISKKYPDYIATDISFAMLKSRNSFDVEKVCCDMSKLPFNRKFDFIFSTFDSINYLLSKKKLHNFFKEVLFVLSNNGIFTFDVSLERNSIEYEISNKVEDNYNGYNFERINKYNKRSKIHYNEFNIIDNNGTNFKEIHKQKIYDIMTYFSLAEKVGFHIESCYDCFTLNDLKADSERAQFILKRVN